MYTSTVTNEQKEPTKLKWWHCAIIYVVANGISLIPAGFNGDEAFYNAFKQPSVAPPDWAFAPVWFINNITSLMALYIIYNLQKDTPGRRSVIQLEVIVWVLYTLFTLFYFAWKSSILGAVDTVLAFLFTVVSLLRSYGVSRKAAWLLAPRLVWLLLASYVSVWIALYNSDAFFGTAALFSR